MISSLLLIDDHEVILVAQDFGPLPDPIIVEVTEVQPGSGS